MWCMKSTKRTVWRIILRRLASDTDWWVGFPGLEYGRTDIDRLALACVNFMEHYWKSEGLARWEPDAAATRIMNAAACQLAGTCDIFCRAGHSIDCNVRMAETIVRRNHLPIEQRQAHAVLTDEANARVLAEINS